MTTVFTLSLTASLIVLLLFPVLNLLVSRCRAFHFNRTLILVGMAVSVLTPIVLPFLAIHQESSSISSIDEVTLATVSSGTTQAVENSRAYLIGFIIYLYWIGVASLILREVAAYVRLGRIIIKSVRTRLGRYTICRHGDRRIAPFSWGKYIVVADDEIEGAILMHEKAHTSKRHWIDVAVADFFCIFLWYNPFAWMLKNLMKLNHEYDADAEVIQSEVDILDYQRLLIAKAIGSRSLPIANNFAVSKRDFRRRVLTMSQRHTKPKMKWIALLVAPAFVFALYVNATPVLTGTINAFSSYAFKDAASDIRADEIAPSTTGLVHREIPATVITHKIPSPINDPEPLLKKFEISIDAVDKELLPDKILARIEVDEDGNIEQVTTNHDNNPNVRAVIDRATNGLQFEVVEENGRKIKTRFAIPIRKSDLPY